MNSLCWIIGGFVITIWFETEPFPCRVIATLNASSYTAFSCTAANKGRASPDISDSQQLSWLTEPSVSIPSEPTVTVSESERARNCAISFVQF